MTKRKIVMIPKDKALHVLAGTIDQNRITLDIFYANGFETRAGGKLADYALTDAKTYSHNEDGKNELTYWSETKVAGALTPDQFHRKYGAIIGVGGKAKTEKKVVKPEITLASATKFAIVDETKPDLMQCHKEESHREYNVGSSDYAKHKIQPWDIWLEYNLNPWEADIVKRILRTKEGQTRQEDFAKIIHICYELIEQIDKGTYYRNGK